MISIKEIRFHEENRYFRHLHTPYLVEFPPGPPAVGEEPVREINTKREQTGDLQLLSSTDCAKDRLQATTIGMTGNALIRRLWLQNPTLWIYQKLPDGRQLKVKVMFSRQFVHYWKQRSNLKKQVDLLDG